MRQMFLEKPTWSADHLPDPPPKAIPATGGNAGIEQETVKRLLMKNARVYLAARSKEKAARAIQELLEETGKEALFLQLDLTDWESGKNAARDFRLRESQLNVLYLKAGIMYPPMDQLTVQGYDATFVTNVIGHYLLTFRDGAARRQAGLFQMYAQSKLAAVALSMHFARTGMKDHVMSVAVDPGNIRSDLFKDDMPWYWKLWEVLFTYPVEYSALSSLFAGGATEAAAYSGKFLGPWARPGKPNPIVFDERKQEKLLVWLED